MPDLYTKIVKQVASLACAMLLAAGPVQAERAGVAAAVNANTSGMPPGGAIRQIVLGQEVLHNEIIETDASGQAQILMLDRTALTVGPNSTLVIDKFIYDPVTKEGELNLTLRRGLMRFTGGALSKSRPVGIATPVATVGIRGGMGLIQVESPTKTNAAFLFGDEMTIVQGGNIVQRIARQGFGTDVTDEGPGQPSRWPVERVQRLMQELQGSDGRSGGLNRQLNTARANAAAQGVVQVPDAATLNLAINQVLSNTDLLRNGAVGSFFNGVQQTRPFNDLPPVVKAPPNDMPREEMRPVDVRPVEVRPVEVRPVEVRPVEVRPVEVQKNDRPRRVE